MTTKVVAAFLLIVMWSGLLLAQQTATVPSSGVVPQLVNFSGKAVDAQGKTISGIAGVTFAIYQNQYEGAPLWMETQNVTADSKGNYTVQLGTATSSGLPLDLFSTGEARWLGVRVNNNQEQPRVLLLSVPYALKAADAQTLDGLPASAFVLAAPSAIGSAVASSMTEGVSPATVTNVTTTGGTVNFLPLFNGTATILDSAVFQTGASPTAKIGINTATPAAALDVTGGADIRGLLFLPPSGKATASATGGKNSQAERLSASVFNSATGTATPQNFQWQVEPVGNDTSTATGSLNLLFAQGSNALAETGLHIAGNGQITFAAGQTFPGAGDGTVTSVATGAGLKGGPITKTGTLTIDTTVVPQLGVANTFTANQTVKGSVSATTVGAGSSAAGTNAVFGINSATSGATNGVYGSTSSPAGAGTVGVNLSSGGYGVYGASTGTASGSAGVYGAATNPVNGTVAIGVLGQNGTESTAENSVISTFVTAGGGVWGDGGTTSNTWGVIGTADEGVAGIFENNSSTFVTFWVQALGSSIPFVATGSAGSCTIDYAGNLNCTGSKNAVVPIDGGKRIVAMSAIEAPQNWFEDAGEAEMVNGAAAIQLDSTYMQTVNTDMKYQVFLTPYGDCKGLYVTNRTANSFEVHELGGGTASLGFGYRIMALRKKFENVRFADHTHDLDGQKRMLEHAHAARATNPQSYMPTEKLSPAPPLTPTTAVK